MIRYPDKIPCDQQFLDNESWLYTNLPYVLPCKPCSELNSTVLPLCSELPYWCWGACWVFLQKVCVWGREFKRKNRGTQWKILLWWLAKVEVFSSRPIAMILFGVRHNIHLTYLQWARMSFLIISFFTNLERVYLTNYGLYLNTNYRRNIKAHSKMLYYSIFFLFMNKTYLKIVQKLCLVITITCIKNYNNWRFFIIFHIESDLMDLQ